MALSPSELTAMISALTARADQSRDDVALLRQQLDAERALGRDRDRQLADLRQENALIRQRLDDHLKRAEVTEAYRRTLLGLVAGAVLAFAANLIVALVRK